MSESSSPDDDADVTETALSLICKTVPEHAGTIRRIFSDIPVRVRLTPEVEFDVGRPIKASPGALFKTILWPPQLSMLMWLLAHGGWETMRDYGSVIVTAYLSGSESVTATEIESEALKRGASDKALLIIDCAIRTARGEEVTLPEWLPNISEAKNIEHAAVRELWQLATAWMLLHELQHLIFADTEAKFENDTDEERACDKGATDRLLADLEEFANSSGQPADKVRGKRAMGALIGLFCIAWLEKPGPHSIHPPIIERLAILLAKVGEKDAGLFWPFAAGLVYVLNRNRGTVVFPRPGTIREVVLALAEGPTINYSALVFKHR